MDHLPVAVANRVALADAPVEGLVRVPLVGAVEEGHEVDAVELPCGIDGAACGHDGGGQDIQGADRLLVDLAGRNASGPLHREGDAIAALEERPLGAAQRRVPGRDGPEAAVVADEDDQGVLLEVVGAQAGKYLADRVVHGDGHGGVGFALTGLHVGEPLQVGLGGLERFVHRRERQAKEEGGAMVAIHKSDSFPPERGGEIRFLGDLLVSAHEGTLGALLGSRQERVAAVVDAVEFIESAAQRCEFVGGPEVPLADKTGGVAQLLEALREHGFGRRDAVVPACSDLLDRWVALDPETHLVPSGHHPCARRVAHRACRVAIRESRAVPGDGVDVRGRDLGAPLEAEFAVAEIIRDDKHDVRRAGGCFSLFSLEADCGCCQAQERDEKVWLHDGWISARVVNSCIHIASRETICRNFSGKGMKAGESDSTDWEKATGLLLALSWVPAFKIQHLPSVALGNGHDAAVPIGVEEGAFEDLFRSVVDRVPVDGGHLAGTRVEGQLITVDGFVFQHRAVHTHRAGFHLRFEAPALLARS